MQNYFEPITFQMNGYNFTIPATAYVIDFNVQNAYTRFFEHDKCVLMLSPQYFSDDEYKIGLGQAFLWQYYGELDYSTNEMMWGINELAEVDTMLVPSAYNPPAPTGAGAFNIFPRQQRPENYLTSNDFTIGGMSVRNATVDINTPYTFVNDESCVHCKVFTNTSEPVVDFASYNYTQSSTYQDLGLGFLNQESLYTLYEGETTVTGIWSSDVWANPAAVNNAAQSTQLTFFLITEVDSVLDTFGEAEIIGLGYPVANEEMAPNSYSLVNTLYWNSVINARYVSLSYAWNNVSQVQLGKDYASLPNRFKSQYGSVVFPQSSSTRVPGW